MIGINATSYSKLAATVFALIALLQRARALAGWQIMFNGMAVPRWPDCMRRCDRPRLARLSCVSGLSNTLSSRGLRPLGITASD
jgi:hypothetical protein